MTLPVIAPGIVAAALFAFAVSFDQFVISYFLAPPGVSTCRSRSTLLSARASRRRSTPSRPIIIVISMGLMLAVARLYRFGGRAMSAVEVDGSASATAALPRWTCHRWRSPKANSSACSVPAAAARPHCCGPSPDSSSRKTATSAFDGERIERVPGASARHRHGVPELRAVSRI